MRTPCLRLSTVFLFLLISSAVHAKNDNHALIFKPVQSYEAGEAIVEIGRPRYLDQDAQGNLYALDVQGRQVHTWDAQGKYRRSFGQKGEGPGEFMFTYPVGELIVYQGKIIVVDESVSKIHFFDLDTGNFERTISRPSNLSRLHLYRTKSGRSLYALNVSGGRAIQEVVKLNLEMEVENVFFSIPYGSTEWLDKVRYIFRPNANQLILCPFRENLLIAETRNNELR
ncbi:MAG: 6-bladed beta-propeller, partial [Acidobacteriota bacterium]|nr:6-bladed beta-propeller [Acidobacteriota bacterium]